MPIKVNLHDNTSQIKVRVSGNDIIPTCVGDDIDYKKLEIMIKDEIVTRITEDAHLQEEIDDLYTKAGAYYLSISENEDGSIDISLLSKDETVLDTKTITLTEKIIKSAELDEENKKLIYTCNDDSVIELDISSLIGQIQGYNCIVINLNSGVSTNYRAARLIRSQLSKYDPVLQRYVNVCIDPSNNQKEIYEIATTEYSNPIVVKNLITLNSIKDDDF